MPSTIKYATANPLDVINAAYERYPETFLVTLEHVKNTHLSAASTMKDRRAVETANKLASGCDVARVCFLDRDAQRLFSRNSQRLLGMSAWMPAYNIACDLLNVPHAARATIVERWKDVPTCRPLSAGTPARTVWERGPGSVASDCPRNPARRQHD